MVAIDTPRKAGRPSRPIHRDQLLRVAREAFAELGYVGASMGDIAGRTGIRKSSLFHHFSTKDELYREALSSIVADMNRLIGDRARGGGDICDRFEAVTRELQLYLGRNPTAARLLLREFVDAETSGGAKATVEAVLANTVSLIDEGIRTGAFAPGDPRHIALSLIGIHFTFFATPSVSGELIGATVFDDTVVQARAELVVEHVCRLLCVKKR